MAHVVQENSADGNLKWLSAARSRKCPRDHGHLSWLEVRFLPAITKEQAHCQARKGFRLNNPAALSADSSWCSESLWSACAIARRSGSCIRHTRRCIRSAVNMSKCAKQLALHHSYANSTQLLIRKNMLLPGAPLGHCPRDARPAESDARMIANQTVALGN